MRGGTFRQLQKQRAQKFMGKNLGFGRKKIQEEKMLPRGGMFCLDRR